MGEKTVSMAELVAGVELAAGESHTLKVAIHDRAEIEDAFFHHDSAVFLPDAPEAEVPPAGDATETPFGNSEFWKALQASHPAFCEDVQEPYDPDSDGGSAGRRDGIPLLLEVLRYADAHPKRRLLVAGHTDTVGDAAYNEKLSGFRASSVVALLEGDRDGFVQAVKNNHSAKDDAVMLRYAARTRGWACDVSEGEAPTPEQIKSFQGGYNDELADVAGQAKLTVDGDVGQKTLGAYLDVMEDDLATQAGGDDALASLRKKLVYVDAKHKTLPCGERYPIEGAGSDNFQSQTNRRVEVLFFDATDLPDLTAADAADRIYKKKLHLMRPLSLQAGALAARATQGRQGDFAIAEADAPPEGVGEPAETLATEMTLRPEARDPDDAWSFLEPLDESRTAVAQAGGPGPKNGNAIG
jgi:hypothetical protein